ncbi:hypothetical protein KI387_005733, partial [Taxus chinensis]
GYTPPTTPITNKADKDAYEHNSKAFNAIIEGLGKLELGKVMCCKSAKEAWDKLEVLYE